MLLFELLRPFLLLAVFGFWVFCLFDALKRHRQWGWVALLAFLPVVSAPFYFANFWLFGGAKGGGGLLDATVGDSSRLRKLQEDAEHSPRPAAWLELAKAYAERARHEDALRELAKVLEADPEILAAQWLAGRSLHALGRAEQAAAHLQFVVDEEPSYRSGEARTLLALVLAAMDREEDGRAHLEAAATQDQHPEAVVRYAAHLAESGDPAEARALLTHLLEREQSMAPDRRAQHAEWLKAARDFLPTIPEGPQGSP